MVMHHEGKERQIFARVKLITSARVCPIDPSLQSAGFRESKVGELGKVSSQIRITIHSWRLFVRRIFCALLFGQSSTLSASTSQNRFAD